MGFVDGLGRLLSGKPVFEAPGDNGGVSSEASPKMSGKYVPRVVVVRAQTSVRGADMEVSVEIKNESSEDVFVDKIRVFDRTVEIDMHMNSGQITEVTVYRGPTFDRQKSAACELQYRKTDGDYFAMQHIVAYGFRDGAYVVDNIRPAGSVSDI